MLRKFEVGKENSTDWVDNQIHLCALCKSFNTTKNIYITICGCQNRKYHQNPQNGVPAGVGIGTE